MNTVLNPAIQKRHINIMTFLGEIKNDYPELYVDLNEVPQLQSDNGNISIEKYESYLNLLKMPLKHLVEK